MKLKFETFLGIVLIGVVIVFGCAWLTSWVTASTDSRGHDRDRGRSKPKDGGFAFQVRSDQGVRTMPELIAEEEQEIGFPLRIRRGDPICRLSIGALGPINGSPLIFPAPPGQPISHEIPLQQGVLYDFPVTKEIPFPIDALSFRSNGITNVVIYWAYCD